MTKVLIYGGSGAKGAALARLLAAAGYSVQLTAGRIPLSLNASRNQPASWPRSAIVQSAAGRLPSKAAAPVQSMTWPAVMKNRRERPLASVTACSLVFIPPFVRRIRRPR